MELLRNPEIWKKNLGEIMLSDDGEFFWMLPEIFIFTYECCVASPYFTVDHESWHLVLMPSDGDQSVLMNNKFMGLFLWMKGFNMPKQKYKVRLTVKETGGRTVCCQNGVLDAYYGFGKWNFIHITEMEECVLSGRIKIGCLIQREEDDPINLVLGSAGEEIESENKTDNTKDGKQKDEPVLKGMDRLAQNFGNLLRSEWGSDVTLKTSDHEFHAHRIVLGVRSPVFSSMFQHDMLEKKTGEVDVSDCSTEGFKVFLQYLYTGNADTMSPENVLDVYYIVDKYQVEDLKSDCVEYIKNNLSLDNFCNVMAFTLRHSESDLQSFASRFFCRNIKKIVITVQWQKYITENPIQANELYIKAINA